jgi:peptidoglycan/LPS O-acetylase OafA/YrhL
MALGALIAVRLGMLGPPLRRAAPILFPITLTAAWALSASANAETLDGPARTLVIAGTTIAVVLGMWSAASRYSPRIPDWAAPAVTGTAGLSYAVYLAHPLFVLAMQSTLALAGIEPSPAAAFVLAAYAFVLLASVATALLTRQAMASARSLASRLRDPLVRPDRERDYRHEVEACEGEEHPLRDETHGRERERDQEQEQPCPHGHGDLRERSALLG